MKLHLPTRLRAAVLACITAVAALSTTIGTGVITTGAVVYALSAVSSTASAAEYTINVSSNAEIMFNDGTSNQHLSASQAGDVITLNVTQPAGVNGGHFESLGNNETKTIAADLIINSLVFNNGYSGTNRTYHFAGNISGSGPFTRGANQFGNNFKFTGDVSGYTGAITMSMKLNNAVNKLIFDASERGDGMTVNASLITMQNGAVLETAGAVTLNSAIALEGSSSLVNNGTLTLAGTLTLGGNSITNNSVLVLGESLKFDLSAEEGDTITLVTGEGNKDLTSLNSGEHVIGRSGYSYEFHDDGTVSAIFSGNSLVWNVASGTWDSSTQNWSNGADPAAYTSGDSVTFGYADANVTLVGDVSPTDMTVSENTVFGGSGTISVTGAFSIAEGKTMTVNDEVVLALSSAEMATAVFDSSVVGTGAVKLETSFAYGEGAAKSSTAATKLIIDESVVLSVGNSDGREVSLSSFSAVDLKGAIKYNNKRDTLNSVSVANGATGTLASWDMGAPADCALHLTGTTVANGTLNVLSYWNSQFAIDTLTGSGTVLLGAFTDTSNPEPTDSSAEAATMALGDMSGFGGTLRMRNEKMTATFSSSFSSSFSIDYMRGGTVVFSGEGNEYSLGSIASSSTGNYKRYLTVNEGVKVDASELLDNWGMGVITVNGELNLSTKLRMASGNNNNDTDNRITGTGTINTNEFSLGNVGHYNVDIAHLNIGAGGMTLAQGGSYVLKFGTTEIGITDSWTAASNRWFELVSTDGTTFNTQPDSTATQGNSATLNGTISGAGVLKKTGLGTLTLGGTNTYTGGTTISGGTLDAKVASALGTGAVTVAEGGTLNLAVGNALTSEQTVTNNGTVILHDTITVGTIANGESASLVIGSDFAGLASAGIVGIDGGADGNGFKQGGTATIFSTPGAITGNLEATFNGETVTIAADGTATLDDDFSTYHVNSALTATETYSAIAAGSVAHSATLSSIDFAVASQTLTVDAAGLKTSMVEGAHAGTVTLAVGNGQTLTADADFAGTVVVAAETTVTADMAGNAAIGTLSLGAGSTLNVSGTGVLTSAAAITDSLTVNTAAGAGLTMTSVEVGTGETFTTTGTGTLTLTSTEESKGLRLIGGTAVLNGTVKVDGSIYMNTDTTAPSLTIAEGANVTAGRLEAGDSGGAASSISIASGATLKITGSDVGAGGNTESYKHSGIVLGEWNSGTNLNVSGVLLAENATMQPGDTGYSLTIENGGTVAVKGIGNPTTDKDGAKTQAVTTNVNGGKLILGAGGINSSRDVTTTLTDGTIGISADAVTIAKGLTLAGTTGNTFDTAKYTFTDTGVTQGSDGGALTVSGIIAGEGKLIKAGAGTLTLSGANTYSGGTAVNAGALSVTSSAGLGTGAVTVAGGALTLDATDAVSMGALTMTSGSIKLAGAEKLAITGAVTLSGGTLDLTNVTVAEAIGNTVLGTVTGAVSVSNVTLAGLSASLTSQYAVSVVKNGDNLVLSVAAKSAPLFWNGGTGDWNNESTNAVWGTVGDDTSTGKAYAPGAQVTISGTEGGTITVSGAQTAASVTIAESGYAITRGENSDSLSITGDLTVDEDVTATLGFLPTVDGNIVLNVGSELTFDAGVLRPGTETILSKATGEGTVKLTTGTGFADSNRVSIGDRTMTASTKLNITGDVAINGWISNEQTGVTGSFVLSKDTTVGGEIRMETGAKLVLGKDVSLTAGTLGLGHESEKAMAVGHLEMTGGSLTVGQIALNNNQANTMNVSGGTLTITGESAFVGTGTATNVAISNATLTNGTDDMTFNHASSLTDVTITAAAKDAEKGIAEDTTITVGGTGMTTTLAGALTTEGQVTLAGTLATDDLTAVNNSGTLTIDAEEVTLAGLNNTGTVTVTGNVELTDATTTGGELSAADVTLTGVNTFSKLTATGTVTSDDTLTVGDGSDMAAVSEGTKLTTTGDVNIGSEASLAALSNAGNTLTVDGALTLTAATTAGGSVVADSLSLTGANTFETLTLTGAVTLDTASYTSVGLTAAGVTGNSLALVVDQATIVSAIGTSTTALTLANVTGLTSATINGESSFTDGSREYSISVTEGLVQITATISNEMVWDATTEGSVWGDGSSWESGTQPTADSNVVFNGTGIADVTVSTGAVAQNVIVESETNFITTGTGEITTDGVEVNNGTLTIGEDVTVTVAETTNVVKDGNIVIVGTLETGALAAADKDVLLSGTLEIAKEGVVNKIKGIDGTCGHLIVGSDLAPLSLELVENKLTIAEDSVVDALTVKSTGDLAAKGSLTVNEDAEVAEGGVMTVADDLTITGSLENNGDITVGSTSHTATLETGKVTNNGTITVYNTMTATDDVINNADATLTVSGGLTATTEGKTVTNNGELTVGGDAEVTALTTGADSVTEITGDATITGDLSNSGALTVNGALEADSLTTAAGATTEAKGGATISTALTNQGTTTITGALTATDAAVTNEATGEGEKLSVSGALAADSLTTAAGATTEAKGGATLGTSLTNHGTTTVTGNLVSADTTSSVPGSLVITNDATGEGEKLTVSGKVSGTSLTTETGATTEINGGVKLADDLVNDGTTTIKGALETADDVFNKGTLTVGGMKADKLDTTGDVRVKGDATLKALAVASTGKVQVDGKLTTEAIDGTAGTVQADKLDLSGLTAAATIANLKADTITLSGFDMLTVTESLSNEAGTGAAKVQLTLDEATMSTLNVGDKCVVVAVDPAATGYGVTLSNLASVNNALKAYGLKGAMVTDGDGQLVMLLEDNSFKMQLGSSANGMAGLEMADAALAAGVAPEGDLARILSHLDELRTAATAEAAAQGDKIGSALSGASVAAMGLALSGDVDRQLRAIRNRTTTMGVNQAVVNEGMPYLNAWVNAEGDYRDIASDGSMPGYKLSSWGGTVGFDVDCTPSFTCGLAATAMYGDFDAKGDDQATGDLNTYYVTAFGRYAKHRWTHTFVATAGLADTTLSRTVDGVNVKGSSEGSMFGGMYEVGYVFALDKEATTCLQPIVNVSYTHATLNGYDESGSDIALKTGDVELNKLTIGAGARVQSVLGENIYNRSSLFEARALVKFDAGDRQGEVTNAFANYAGSASVKSVETGAFGAEFGVGLTVPVGAEGGNLFMDASAEIRSEYVNVNGTVGYRVNF